MALDDGERSGRSMGIKGTSILLLTEARSIVQYTNIMNSKYNRV